MPMTPKQMIRLLEQNGFVLVSANGSHYKYHNPTTNKTTVVPFHAKDSEARHREKHSQISRTQKVRI